MTATSPEELETLLEDAVLLRDDTAVQALFEDRGVLVAGPGPLVRERGQVAEVLSQQRFLASTRSVTVVRGVAVSVGDRAVSVSCRGPDTTWRFVAVILMPPRERRGLWTAS